MLKSWLRCAKKSPEFRRLPSGTFFRHYEKIVKAILVDPGIVKVAVVRPSGKLYSFLVVDLEHPVLHFVYTAGGYRRMGFAKDAAKYAGFHYDEPFGFTFPSAMTTKLMRDRRGPLYLGDAILHRYT